MTLVHAGQVARLDPKSGEVRRFDLGAAESRPMVIATGPDDSVWFGRSDNRIGRITADGEVASYEVSGSAYGVCAGADGAMWFTLMTADRSTLDGAIDVQSLPTEGAAPVGIAAGEDGVWFAEIGAGRIGRIGHTARH
ncbi:hypothetical protein OG394_26885 [Kribbella sp. NBC_01245]|nr:hypothetical protein [Kribbella sp. NBC_01245]